MRVHRRHAWGAVLIALFALPVLRPEGIPAFERPVGSFFAWFSRMPVLNPLLWGSSTRSVSGEHDPRAKALEEENALLREQYARRLLLEEDAHSLAVAFEQMRDDGLDRLPRVLDARVLRGTDSSTSRRSILIDRGEEDGLVPGLAVVSGRVLLGKVAVVRGRSALVELLTDRRSRLEVSVRTDKNVRLRGYVRGEGRGADEGDLEIGLLRVPDDAGRILVGAPVFTSNADPRVPSSLIVGTVTSVTDKDLDGMPQVTLAPALDLGRALHVFVLKPDAAFGTPPAR